ncbi:hypothetical protein [Deinococcus peraridilitoris]|uniref:Uncharacterized protein n=1 Tax=Deinococcus peraridilitoris (strain DSM 19664 / LMG 22246 / CIP 109416 / KR-200) TaxID=937777 RepID=L0A161_DEIPD|nr:hypothetical protein [Deinococcus peraridilitoris]AFZ66927.1 hypothetical protein Deipe_1382 [Deinococcus peraridilitoris DSM 19664]
MDEDIAITWTNYLTEEQRERLRVLRAAKCTVEAQAAPADPLHDMPEGLIIEVLVDKHAVVKIRGTAEELPEIFEKAYQGAQALFMYVNRPETTEEP